MISDWLVYTKVIGTSYPQRVQKVCEYAQEKPQPHIADPPVAARGRSK